ncbi:endonuclease/exonuclease/phosphatase family protein [Nitrogeniibacter aestuarii]|uniref:endonuclease/exonuclease/phosphatase family protein n=1 Tax=Nitrogeniibacter aestuarii TaxID=2815343 RepID=UPI001E573B57|nr:endonuclease/exonuclease/phosphatase family protein [Nitrogeniibacter aestuarii]
MFLIAMLGITTPWISRLTVDMPRVGWLSDLGSHWQWFFVPAAMFTGIFAWRGLARIVALLALGAGLYGLWVVMPPLAAKAEAEDAPTLRVVTANVMYTTGDPVGVMEWALSQRADIILLQEVNGKFAQTLETMTTGFPHRHLLARDDPFGIGIVSRYPLSHSAVVTGPGGIPMLEATVDTPDGAVPVLVVHPFPPLTEVAHRERAELIHLVDTRAGKTPTLIVGGDFNATPWSSAFNGVRHLGIASRGLPTWREVLPIDHVMVGSGWALRMADRGPANWSDHRPLVVELARRSAGRHDDNNAASRQ